MANISENLSTVKQSLIDIKNAIIDKGVTPTGNITTYADAINQLCLCGESVEGTEFYIENISDSEGVFKLTKINLPTYTPNLIYRIDNGEWFEYDVTTLPNITVPSGSKIYLKGNNPNGFNQTSGNYYKFSFSQNYNIGGYITSLIAIDNFNTITDIPQYSFNNLFFNESKLLNAKDLITSNIINVGNSSFYDCFQKCTSLTTAPRFENVTTVGGYGFNSTFQNCTALTTVPNFNNITTVGTFGFNNCFQGCTSLQVVYAPNITTWNTSNFQNWLSNVSPTGVVFKSESLEISTGTSGIPTGWITLIKN